MESTNRLALPLLSPGQSQKEIIHNEALQRLDTLVNATVEEPPLTGPPASVSQGQSFIVGSGATGAWIGRENCIATWSSGGWRFAAPTDGMAVYVRSKGVTAAFHEGAWDIGTLRANRVFVGGMQVVGPRQNAIPDPTGGTAVDGEARLAIAAILDALRAHGLVAP